MLYFFLHKNVCGKVLTQSNISLETSESGYLIVWYMVLFSI